MKVLYQVNLDKPEGPGFVLQQIRQALEDSGHELIYHYIPVRDPLAFDRAASKQVVPCDLLVSGVGGSYYQQLRAKRYGAKVLLTRFSPHHAFTQRVLAAHYAYFGRRVFGEGQLERALQEYPLADYHLVLSSQSKQTYVREGIAADRVFVANLGVDTDFFTECPMPDHTSAPFRVLFIATNAIRKGWRYLLPAWEQAFHDIEDVELIVKSSMELANLNPQIRPITQWFDMDELRDLYHHVDITALPSIEDGFGATVLESMACGRLPIVTDVTGAADVVTDGSDGYIVPVADVDALAEALYSCYADYMRTIAMGRCARETAELHPWSRFRSDVIRAVNAIAKQKGL